MPPSVSMMSRCTWRLGSGKAAGTGGNKKTPLTCVRGEKDPFHGTTLICLPNGRHLTSSCNGDEPFRSSRTAPKWLASRRGLRACTGPLSLKAGFTRLALSSRLLFIHYTASKGFVKPGSTKFHASSDETGWVSSGPLPPICISCHWARVISSCRGLEPSKGPTMPRSSIWSTRRAARE